MMRSIRHHMMIFLIGFFSMSFAAAPMDDYLEQEKLSLTGFIRDINLAALPENEVDYQKKLNEMKTLIESTSAKIVFFENFLANQDPQATKTIEALKANLSLLKQYKAALSTRLRTLETWDVEYATQQQLKQLQDQLLIFEKEQAVFYLKNTQLHEHYQSGEDPPTSLLWVEKSLFFNNLNLLLLDYQASFVRQQMELMQQQDMFTKTQDMTQLKELIVRYEQMLTSLEDKKNSLQQELERLQCKQPDFYIDYHLKQECVSIETGITQFIKRLEDKKAILATELKQKQKLLRKQLAARLDLNEYPGSVVNAFIELFHDLPKQIKTYMYSFIQAIQEQLPNSRGASGIVFFGFFMIQILFFYLHRWLTRMIQEKNSARLAGQLYEGFLILLQRNIFLLDLMVSLVCFFYWNHVSLLPYGLVVDLFWVYFLTRQIILISKLLLFERMSDVAGKDVILYYRTKKLIILGGWSIALMMLSHQWPLSVILQDFFDRVFMLFLFIVSIVAWYSRDVISPLLMLSHQEMKRYVRHAISVLVIFIPLTLLITAIVGLSGFLNLAWTMGRYQIYFFVILIGYILLRGLIRDLLDLSSEWMVHHLKNGWVWVEAILNPLERLMRLVLFLGSIILFLAWADLLSDPNVIAKIATLGKKEMIHWSNVHITPFSFFIFYISAMFFIWLTKWSRECSYRWIYQNIEDPGIRNSLSIFTQYGIGILGAVFTLRALGVEFTGMMVVLGGLAVGMGFGLRDFASNIVGGIMLLIERPVREGDVITIGDYEGKVSHIGLRSMRVSSWDNMEVWVPNAETFSKPFTNWTHQDNVVRTVVPIKVSRLDDPVTVQWHIYDVLNTLPEVLKEPESQVFLKKIDDALIEFEVRYFINVKHHTRFEIRSKVLFAIMKRFKEEHIKAPIPPYAVMIHEGHDE